MGYIHLLHLRARWYDVGTGTFLSRDPVESEPAYQYVRGNVVNLTDPEGNSPCDNPPIPTPTPPPPPPGELSLDEIRITLSDTHGGKVEQYLRQEKPEIILARVAMGETDKSELDRTYVMWIARKRTLMYDTTINYEILKPGAFQPMDKMRSIDAANHPFNPAFTASRTGEAPFNICNPFSDMLHVCDTPSHISGFRKVYAEAKTIVNASSSLVPVELRGFDSFGYSGAEKGKVYWKGGRASNQLAGGNVYQDVMKVDNEGGY